MQALDGSLRAVGEVDVHRHHVGIPGERLAAKGIVHSQPLASYSVQQLLPPNTWHWTQQLEWWRRKKRVCPSLAPTKGHPATGIQSYPLYHISSHIQIRTIMEMGPFSQLTPSLFLLTEGTREESVSVRPSRSAAKLVDTTVGGDTGWMLGGVTVGGHKTMMRQRQSWLGLNGEPRVQEATIWHHGQ